MWLVIYQMKEQIDTHQVNLKLLLKCDKYYEFYTCL